MTFSAIAPGTELRITALIPIIGSDCGADHHLHRLEEWLKLTGLLTKTLPMARSREKFLALPAVTVRGHIIRSVVILLDNKGSNGLIASLPSGMGLKRRASNAGRCGYIAARGHHAFRFSSR